MAIGSLSGIDSLTSLISMQSSVRSAGSVRSAQNELQTQASVYQPSNAYAGDPEKANALTAKAQNLNGTIGKITSDVQTSIQDSTQKAADSQSSGAPSTDSTDDTDETATGSVQQGLTYDAAGNLVPAQSLNGSGSDSAQTAVLNRLV